MDKIQSLVNKINNEHYRELSLNVGIEMTDYCYQKYFEESEKIAPEIKIVRDYTIKKMIKSVLAKYWNAVETMYLMKRDDFVYSFKEHNLPQLSPSDDIYPPAFNAAKEYMENDISYSQDYLKKLDKAIINNKRIMVNEEDENKYQFGYLEKFKPDIRVLYSIFKQQKNKDDYLDKHAYFAYLLYYLPKNKSFENSKTFYYTYQKSWFEKFWKKELHNYVYYFDDNIMIRGASYLYNNGYPPFYLNPLKQGVDQFRAKEKKSLISILKSTELKELLKSQYKSRTSSAINYILTELAYSKDHENLLPIIPPFASLGKAVLFTALVQDYNKKLTIDDVMLNNAVNIFSKKAMSLLSISDSFISTPISTMFYNLSNKVLCRFQDLNNFSRIFKVLFDITEGDLDKLDQLAVVFAKIILGNKFFKIKKEFKNQYAELKECHPVTVITTNNKYFIYQFFEHVFLFDLNENNTNDKVAQISQTIVNSPRCIVQNNTGIKWHDSYKNLNGFTNVNGDLFTTESPEEKAYRVVFERSTRNPHDYEVRMNKIDLRYLFPTNEPKPNVPYHLTFYRLRDFLSDNKTGAFIEDKFYGHLLNICVDDLKERPNEKEGKRLNDLFNGNMVTYNHPLLGNQTYKSNSNYIFIQESVSDASILFDNNFDLLQLSPNLPNRSYLFEGKEDFTPWEKAFMTLNFVLHGFNLILNPKTTSTDMNPSNSSPTQESSVEAIIPEFIKRCCNIVSVDIDNLERATENTATFLRTLHAAYLTFYNESFGTKQELPKINSGWNKNIHNYFGEYKNKCYIGHYKNNRQYKGKDLYNRDLNKGYIANENDTDKSELPKMNTNANVCIGLVVKPKAEVISQGKLYKEELEEKIKSNIKPPSRKVSLGEFVGYLSAIAANINPKDTEKLIQYLDQLKSAEA